MTCTIEGSSSVEREKIRRRLVVAEQDERVAIERRLTPPRLLFRLPFRLLGVLTGPAGQMPPRR